MSRKTFAEAFLILLKELDLLKGRTKWLQETVGYSNCFGRWTEKGMLPSRKNWNAVVGSIRRKRANHPSLSNRLAELTRLLHEERNARVQAPKGSGVEASSARNESKLRESRHGLAGDRDSPENLAVFGYQSFLSDTRIAAQLRTSIGKRSIYLDDVYVHRMREEQVALDVARRYWERPKGYWLSIEGDAGHGKTSLLWFLAQELHRTYGTVLPVQAQQLAANGFDDLVALFPVEGGPFFVLLDTLDLLVGIDDARLSGLLNKIRARGSCLITTCRRQEVQIIAWHAQCNRTLGLGRYEPAEAHAAIGRYVEQAYPRWPRVRKDAQIEHVWELLDSQRRIQDLNFEPLLLRMIFEAYVPNDVPSDINTQQVYDHFWEQRVLGDRGQVTPEVSHARSLLSRVVASHLYFDLEVHTEKLSVDRVAQLGQSNGISNPLTIMRGLVSSGVLRWWQIKESVGFFHQTFLEYTAAKALLTLTDRDIQRRSIDLLLTDLHRANLFRVPVLKQFMIQSSAHDHSLFRNLCSDVVEVDTPIAARLALEVLGKANNANHFFREVLEWVRRRREMFCEVAPDVLRYFPVGRLHLAFEILEDCFTENTSGKICAICGGTFAPMAPEQTLAFLGQEWQKRPTSFRGHETDLKTALIALFKAGATAALDLITAAFPRMSPGLQTGTLNDLSELWAVDTVHQALAFLRKLFDILRTTDRNEVRSAFVRAFASFCNVVPLEGREFVALLTERIGDAADPNQRILLARLTGVAGIDAKVVRSALADLTGPDHFRRMCACELLREAAAKQSAVVDELLALPADAVRSEEVQNSLYSVVACATNAASMLAVLKRWPPTERGAGEAYRTLVKNAVLIDPPQMRSWLKAQMPTAVSPARRRQILVGFQMLAESSIGCLTSNDARDLFHWGFSDRNATDEMRHVIIGFAGRFVEIDISFTKTVFRSIFGTNRQDFIRAAVNSLRAVDSIDLILYVLNMLVDFTSKKKQYAPFGHFLAIIAENRPQEARHAVAAQLGKPKAISLIKDIDNAVTVSGLLKVLKSTASADPQGTLAIAEACPILDDGNAATLAVLLRNVAYHVEGEDLGRALLRRILDLASNPSDRVGNALHGALKRLSTVLPHREAVAAVRTTIENASNWNEHALERLAGAAKRMNGWSQSDTEELLRRGLPHKVQAALLA